MPDPAGIEKPAVLFDWGDTLFVIPGMINAPEAHLACAREVFVRDYAPLIANRANPIDVDRFVEVYFATAREQIKRSAETLREHTFQDRLVMAFEECGAPNVLSTNELDQFAHALCMQVLDGARAVEGAADAVHRLSKRFRLGLLSNYPMPVVVEGTLQRFGLDRAFERVTISGEIGWMKPHENAYRALLDGFIADPSRAVFVGDNLENDVIGPKRLGLKTAWFAPGKVTPAEPSIDFHAHTLGELVEWCERAFD